MSRILKLFIALTTLLIANLASAASSNPTEALRLYKADPRAINTVTVAVSYRISGHLHYDYEVIGSWNKNYSLEIRQTAGTQDSNGTYGGDFLHLTSTGSSCTSNCSIYIEKTDQRTFTDLVVEISFTVGGSTLLHYDAEAVGMPGAPAWGYGEDFLEVLNVDGRNASWDGSVYRGNLLKAPAQVSSFYWDTNQVGYNSEIWAEGIPAYTSGRLYYDNSTFGAEFLYYVNFDANGIGHSVYSDHYCSQLRMRVADIYAPQSLRIIDNSGATLVSFTTNVLRACSYAP